MLYDLKCTNRLGKLLICFATLGSALLLAGCAKVVSAESAPNMGAAQSANVSAATAHYGRVAAGNLALSAATSMDPTGLSQHVSGHAEKRFNEWSRNKMLEDFMKDYTPEQRELVEKQMKGQLSKEEYQRQLFEQAGLDENGNPVKTDDAR